ncbi:MAG: hypothetical protein J1G05_00745 [Clostridiales bacterium]|nr:hypothetical protein [Clostridiales bacterium]
MQKISFFSYKGGSGRTSMLYNTLPFLVKELGATKSEPIIVIDLDLDSKGLTYLFSRESRISAVEVLKDDDTKVKFDEDNASCVEEHSFFKLLAPVGQLLGLSPEENDAVLFISANSGSNINLNGLNNYDASSDVSLTWLNKICTRYRCKAIIMDTPAGDQLTGTLALGLSDKIITVLRITNQFQLGTYEFLQRASSRFVGLEFIIVPNAVPKLANTKYSIEKVMERIVNTTTAQAGRNKVNFAMIKNGENGIGEVELFKFAETCLNKKEYDGEPLEADETVARDKFKKLAREIVNG